MDKESFMKIIRQINQAPKESIEVLRETKICHLRTIQRASKNIKDPNPLSSMMASITQKFPISVDHEKYMNANLPTEFLDQNDTHQYGRKICKMDAIRVFVDTHEWKSKEHREETAKTVGVLFGTKRKEVKLHYSFDWKEATIKFGQVFMVRAAIEMNDVTVKIPKEQRNALMMAAVAPQFCLDYENVDPQQLKKLKEIRDLKMTSKISLDSQLKILGEQMDPKIRTVPAVVGRSAYENRNRHAFCSNNFQIMVKTTNQEFIRESNSKGLEIMGKMCYHLLLDGRSEKELRLWMRDVTINRVGLSSLLASEVLTENIYVKVLLTVKNMGVTNSSKLREVKFYPEDTDVKRVFSTTAGGVRYFTYSGRESVSFDYNNICGNFVHEMDQIFNIAVESTDKETLSHIIGAIAVYCKRGFDTSTERNLSSVKTQVFLKHLRRPYSLLNISKEEWDKSFIEGKAPEGIVYAEDMQCTNSMTSLGSLIVEEDRVYIKFKNEQTLDVQPCEAPTIPPEINGIWGHFEHFLPPSQRLQKLIFRYVQQANYYELKKCIERREWHWGNERIARDTVGHDRARISFTARSILSKLDIGTATPHLVAFYYCFCGGEEGISNVKLITNFCWKDIKIDFQTSPGSFFSVDKGIQRIDNKIIQMSSFVGGSSLIPMILPGYIMEPTKNETIPVTTIYELSQRPAREKDQFCIFVGGLKYLVKKDRTFESKIEETLSRNQTSLNIDTILGTIISNVSGLKRKREDGGESSKGKALKYEAEYDSDELF